MTTTTATMPDGFPGVETEAALDPMSLARIEQSDIGNAKRFVARFGERFKYVAAIGWFAFTGTHWTAKDAEYRAMLAAFDMLEQIRAEADTAEALGHKEMASSLRSHALKSSATRNVQAMLKAAQPMLLTELSAFDRNPLALNVQNGTLLFERDQKDKWRVRKKEHDPRDMISRLAPVKYEPKAEAPLWYAHLERMQPKKHQRDFLQRILGYCATGLTGEQAFFIFQGRGGDGKSTTVNTIRRVLGEYSTTADVKTFMSAKSQGGDAASPALASLAGDVRLVSTSEPPRGSQLNDGVIKLATGGAPLKVRHLNKGLFEYIPLWKIILECNALPVIPGADEGIWRRCKLLLWRVQLKRHEMDGELENKLFGEAPGVLNWIIEGVLDYLTQGSLADPAEAKDDLAAYRAGANVFGEWASTRLIIEASATVEQKELRGDYESFCEAAGYEPMGAKQFLDELTNLQITRAKSLSSKGRNVMRRGARLRTEDDPPIGGQSEAREDDSDIFENDENPDLPVFES